jgi:hypothetical protein
MTKPTVGKLATDLQKHEVQNHHTADEQMSEQLSDYDKNIFECVERSKKDYAGDFFIVVLTKKEKLLSNVIRNYFYPRSTCPTPDYDQTVYFYNRKDDAIDFVWVIPSRETCHQLKDNALLVAPEERQLLNFVLEFADGTLYKLAKKLNGENDDSITLQGA